MHSTFISVDIQKCINYANWDTIVGYDDRFNNINVTTRISFYNFLVWLTISLAFMRCYVLIRSLRCWSLKPDRSEGLSVRWSPRSTLLKRSDSEVSSCSLRAPVNLGPNELGNRRCRLPSCKQTVLSKCAYHSTVKNIYFVYSQLRIVWYQLH